ncbi:MAG: ATP-binding protein [Gammaproteobacteria bacterium]|nr:MAG: ATP-binding protein [Gammaproteobacteria bacterium]
MKRSLIPSIQQDLKQKMVLLTGPRQVGKTYLSKDIIADYDYFNYDYGDDRQAMADMAWNRKSALIIFDELHKKPNWKNWLKGIYDVEGIPPAILVTGSVRLNTYLKASESLAGRFFQIRLHPLDLKELYHKDKTIDLTKTFDSLLQFGGFPEPFLKKSVKYYNRWKQSHLDVIIRQDLIQIEQVRQITKIENLIQLLRTRVGSTISYQNLSQDLMCSNKTVKNWLEILENMFVVFKVLPYNKKINRSLKKAPKYYFYDTGQVMDDKNKGAKFENLVACAFKKEIDHQKDCQGENYKLNFLRTKDGKEVDFLICQDDKPITMIEAKYSDDKIHKHFDYFDKQLPNIEKIQLIAKDLKREKTYANNLSITDATSYLARLSF